MVLYIQLFDYSTSGGNYSYSTRGGGGANIRKIGKKSNKCQFFWAEGPKINFMVYLKLARANFCSQALFDYIRRSGTDESEIFDYASKIDYLINRKGGGV